MFFQIPWPLVLLLPLAASVAIFPALYQTQNNPRYGSQAVLPPTRETFGSGPEFATLRSLDIAANNTLVDYEQTISQYATMGDVIWPVYQTIFTDNFVDLLSYMKANQKYLTDLWGFVPGTQRAACYSLPKLKHV